MAGRHAGACQAARARRRRDSPLICSLSLSLSLCGDSGLSLSLCGDYSRQHARVADATDPVCVTAGPLDQISRSNTADQIQPDPVWVTSLTATAVPRPSPPQCPRDTLLDGCLCPPVASGKPETGVPYLQRMAVGPKPYTRHRPLFLAVGPTHKGQEQGQGAPMSRHVGIRVLTYVEAVFADTSPTHEALPTWRHMGKMLPPPA